MDQSVVITLGFLVFAIIMFAWEKIPLSITAMIVAVGLHLTGVLSAKAAFAGFVDTNVLLFMGMFIVGAAFFETGLAVEVGNLVTKVAKTETRLIIAIMMITGLLSGFLSNTGTAAVLIPVVIGICKKANFSQTRMMMPLVFAAAMGGNISLIGAPGNMIAQAGLQQAGLQGFEFFDYGKIGLPMLIVGTIFYATIGKRFLPATPSRTPDASYQGNDDYSHIPSWKKWIAGLVLVGTVAAMIFEKELGVKLYVSAWIGALILVATNVITETAAIVVGSSLAYATPIGMPANTMVYNIAGYSFMDYVKAGIPLIVVSMIVSLILLPILFPFHP